MKEILKLYIPHYFITVAIICLAACASKPEETIEGQAEELYQKSIASLDAGAYDRAIRLLEALEAQFPFEGYADQAQLELIYAHYKARNYEIATDIAERFIRLRPDHPNVDYAFYMKGIVSFHQDSSFFGRFIAVDSTLRDAGTARDAYVHFAELLSLYPNSVYAADVQQRIIFLRNLIARSEINVANYYFERGAFLAATNRGRYVIENFEGSPAVPDGLAVMAQGYTLLGYEKEADNAIKILRENYPEHPALNSKGELKRRNILSGTQRSLLNRISFGLLGTRYNLGFDTRKIYNKQYGKVKRAAKS